MAAEQIAALKNVSILAFLSDEDLESLSKAITEKPFKKGETLLQEGSTGSEVYIIVKGQCDVIRGGRAVATVGVHQIVGEMAALSPERRSATITASTDGLAYVLSGFDFRASLATNPKMAMQLIKGLITRLRKAEAEAAELRIQLVAKNP